MRKWTNFQFCHPSELKLAAGAESERGKCEQPVGTYLGNPELGAKQKRLLCLLTHMGDE